MIVTRVELRNFRNYAQASFELNAGVTAVVGSNGQGKTNLVEALGYLATLDSFRGAPGEALVKVGADQAVIRAQITAEDREVLIELSIASTGRSKVLVNKQPLRRTRDLLGVMRVTVFSPDDLAVIKEGPAVRRRFMDDTLVALAVKYDAMRLELERVLRQRNTLLKNLNGRLNDDALFTLDVWDAKFAELGDRFGLARATLVAKLAPMVTEAYEQLAGQTTPIELRYEPGWRARGLANALAESRAADVRRGVSTVGPHRDDVELFLRGMPARIQASQGEQRSLALALRLAAHRLVTERAGSTPLLVLDDVLSELDPQRAAALLTHLPPGQVVLTTASDLPASAAPDVVQRIHNGSIV
ncbi:MAG TPA: DNA replication/repair protein RecF [Ilumatobacteraceae bacterium]|nr:DNA replication/repair protein RecF [Ilumatobacteraceae bacterium]